MTTCSDFTTELAALKAAERSYLIGGRVNMIQDGEKRLGKEKFDYPALQARIRYVQSKVDYCNGCYGTSIVHFSPVDR